MLTLSNLIEKDGKYYFPEDDKYFIPYTKEEAESILFINNWMGYKKPIAAIKSDIFVKLIKLVEEFK